MDHLWWFARSNGIRLSRVGAALRLVGLEHVCSALRAGASRFLLKDASAEALVDAVRVVAAGDAMLAPSVTRRS